MAIEQIEESVLEDLQPQVVSITAEMMKKVSVLVGKKVSAGAPQIVHGEYDAYHRKNRVSSVMTKVALDGEDGGIYFLASMELAIVLACNLIGKPENTVKDKVQNIDFDDELNEIYGEISNQLCGICNQALIAAVDNNIHLTLKETAKLPANGSQKKKIDPYFYLFVTFPVTVEGGFTYPMTFIISKNFSKKFFDIDLGAWRVGGEENGSGAGVEAGSDTDAGGSGQILRVGNFEKALAKDFSRADYPGYSIKESIGDAYDFMESKNLDCLPILDEDNKVVKVVTKNNIEVIRSVFFEAPGQDERISRLMCLPLEEVDKDQVLVSVDMKASLKDVVKLMVEHKIHAIPLVDEEYELKGMITSHEVLGMISGA